MIIRLPHFRNKIKPNKLLFKLDTTYLALVVSSICNYNLTNLLLNYKYYYY